MGVRLVVAVYPHAWVRCRAPRRRYPGDPAPAGDYTDGPLTPLVDHEPRYFQWSGRGGSQVDRERPWRRDGRREVHPFFQLL